MTMTVLLGTDAEARKSRPVTLDPTSTASTAFVVVATECTDHWRTNEALLLESRAMPHLHQTRVGIRRLRSSFSLFRPLLDAVPGAFDVAHRLRTLALPLGPARDLDVLLTGPLVDGLDTEQVAHLAGAREAAYDRVAAILRSSEWADAGHALDALLAGAPWPGVDDPPVRELAGRCAGEALAPGRRPRRPAGRHGAVRAAPGAHRGQEAALRLRVLRLPVRRRHAAGRHRLGRGARRAGSPSPGTSSRCRRRSGPSTTTRPPTGCCARSARPRLRSTSTTWSTTRSTRCVPWPPSSRSGTDLGGRVGPPTVAVPRATTAGGAGQATP